MLLHMLLKKGCSPKTQLTCAALLVLLQVFLLAM